MNDYLLCVIGTVLVCSILTGIAPEGRTSAVIKGVARLSCVLAIIAPVLAFLKTGDVSVFSDKNGQEIFLQEGIEGESAFIQYYSEMRIQQTEESLEEGLFERYAVPCAVRLEWSVEEEIRIERIVVALLENVGEEVKGDMRLFLVENYCEEVLIE